MKQLILKISGDNISGSSWSWEFHLANTDNDTFKLNGQQNATEEEPWVLDARNNLADGADICTNNNLIPAFYLTHLTLQ